MSVRGPRTARAVAVLSAAVPAVAMTAGIPFANRTQPLIAGLPFLLGYLAIWIALTPIFLYVAFRALERDE